MSSKQPNKFSDLDKSHTKHGGVLIEHICEKNLISNETAEIINFTFFIVSLLNQSSYPTGTKHFYLSPYLSALPIDAMCYAGGSGVRLHESY